MKSAIYVILACCMSPAFAATGMSATAAQSAVVSQAHAFIARNATDFGGNVHSPCTVNLSGDAYTVTCTGTAEETIGGGGSVAESFKCVGDFTEGQDGLFYKASAIHCK